MWYRARCLSIRLLAVVLVTVCAATPAFAQKGTKKTPQDSGTIRWDDGTFRAGDAVRLEPHLRFQSDVLLTDETRPVDDRFDWARRRIGVDGVLFKRVEFQVERELVDSSSPWRDVYGDVRISQAIHVRAGRFKIPFSMEHTTSGFDLDFLERATAVTAMSPGRDLGIMVHGRTHNRLFKYEAGVFQHTDSVEVPVDGNRSNVNAGLGTLAGRVTVAPVRDDKNGLTRDLQFGVAMVRNTMPEGLYGVVGHSLGGDRFFERMNVNGARTRLGVEGLWSAGRFTLKGELLQLTDERKQQAIDGSDLSNLIVRGAYLSGIWRAYGGHGQKHASVDVSARFDRMSFASANTTDEAFTNPRADHVAPLSQRALTFGATWTVNRWIRLQGNAVRAQLVDPLDVRDLAPVAPWTTLMRLQFGL